jgi:hypothetical protein
MSNSNTNGKYGRVNANSSQGTIPPVPPPPLLPTVNINENTAGSSHNELPTYNESSTCNELPTYNKALEFMRTSSESEVQQDNEVFNDVVFASSELPSDNPFDREGFGRQSMSEKRARASIDAKKTEMYQKRERQKMAEENKGSDKTRPSSSHENMNGEGTPSPLRKARSEGHMQAVTIDSKCSFFALYKQGC